jgi:hypothetical protein
MITVAAFAIILTTGAVHFDGCDSTLKLNIPLDWAETPVVSAMEDDEAEPVACYTSSDPESPMGKCLEDACFDYILAFHGCGPDPICRQMTFAIYIAQVVGCTQERLEFDNFTLDAMLSFTDMLRHE